MAGWRCRAVVLRVPGSWVDGWWSGWKRNGRDASEDGDDLIDLPDSCRIDNMAAMEEKKNFADVRMAWNELGIGLQVSVTGKSHGPQGDASKPRFSDGVTVWLDTRDAARAIEAAARRAHAHFIGLGPGPHAIAENAPSMR